MRVTTWCKDKPQCCTHITKSNFDANIVENPSQIIDVLHDLGAKASKLPALDEYSRRYENLHTSQRLIKSMASFVAKGSTDCVAVVVASDDIPILRRVNQPLRR